LSGVSGVGVRAFRVRVPVRVRCVRTGDLVERVGGQPHSQGMGLAALPYPRTARATSPSQSRAAEPAQAVLGQRRRRAEPGRRRGGARAADRVRSPGRPGTAGCAGSPVGLGAGRRAVHPKLWHGGAQAVRGRVGGMRPTMTWAGRRRRPGVGSGSRPGPGVARSGRVLGSTAAEGVRPHRGPSGQGARPGWARQRSELGEQWWACQDLNLGPHPYQLNAGNRCAHGRSRRSRPTVGAEVMRSIDGPVCVHPVLSSTHAPANPSLRNHLISYSLHGRLPAV
jgi:hypothetical protein